MRKKLRVLVMCETSGTVRDAFIRAGHHAISVDILPHDSGKKKNHVQMDAILYLRDNAHKFDLMIAHPPCTYLCNSGVGWLWRVDGKKQWNKARAYEVQKGAALFNLLLHASVPFIAVENPVQHKYARLSIRKQDQVIQPWMFGHPESKATCLWLVNLPKLQPTKNVKAQWRALPPKQRNRLHWLPPSPLRWKLRSKTYDGIAQAMAEQWGPYVLRQLQNDSETPKILANINSLSGPVRKEGAQ